MKPAGYLDLVRLVQREIPATPVLLGALDVQVFWKLLLLLLSFFKIIIIYIFNIF